MAQLNTHLSAPPAPTASSDVEHALRARVAELEALLEARTQTIVSLGATVAELQGTGASTSLGKLRDAEQQIEALQNTKLYRYAALPRRWYGALRRAFTGG